MNNEKFTPGPWWALFEGTQDIFVEPGIYYKEVRNEAERSQAAANAYLISAAPEMYDWQSDALAEMRRICPMLGVPYDLRERLEHLIERGEEIQKKARGKE